MTIKNTGRLRNSFFTGAVVTAMTFLLAATLRLSAMALEYPQYAVYVNGTAVCASDDRGELGETLRTILAGYMTENTETAYFKQDVVVDRLRGQVSGTAEDLEDMLTVVTVGEEKGEEKVPYLTMYTYSQELYTGDCEVTSPGREGLAQVEYVVYRENGVESDRRAVSAQVEVEPVAEEMVLGAKERLSTGSYIAPTTGIISSSYGPRNSTVGSKNHKGLDIAGPAGTEIYAADGGEVIEAGWVSGYGNFIKISHDGESETCYGHMSELLVEEGDTVQQGDLIGLMGSTGNSTGSHLHFEIRVDGEQVDPESVIDFESQAQ